jgi:2-oxoacid:acceptor oxidoreductase delta subunit (pyruvate/2-ketoisovalerate family)
MEKPFAITLDVGSSLANKTGLWRTSRPVYVDRLPPCNHACPAGENIQGWLYHAEGGDYETAWRALTDDNPLPAVMGRVCHHPCESACNRGRLDEAVGIGSVERFLGDEAIRRRWAFAPPEHESGKRVLVVGAGPSGLSAAYHLRRRGHRVTIAEAGPLAGGMMRFGIPKCRLPRDVLDAEVRRIVALGVELRLDRKVANVLDAMRDGGFDATFLAVGAHIAKRASVEFETLESDALVLAPGQEADLSLLDGVPGLVVKDGAVEVGPDAMTGHPGIFADGDAVPTERTVTVAVGRGRKAARHIDAWLRGGTYAPPPKHELATFEHLNPWYYSDAPATVRPVLDRARRASTFDEAVAGLDETNALFEARRCLSCGNCFECDNCYGVCPDNAVIKLGPGRRFAFNYDYCKGCAICVSECPCGAIRMVRETI